jgi:hypothetical protein
MLEPGVITERMSDTVQTRSQNSKGVYRTWISSTVTDMEYVKSDVSEQA